MNQQIQEAIRKVLEWESEIEKIPFVSMWDISNYLVPTYNSGECIEHVSQTNGWDIDWWFYFPLEKKKILCFSGWVFNSNEVDISLAEEEDLPSDY